MSTSSKPPTTPPPAASTIPEDIDASGDVPLDPLLKLLHLRHAVGSLYTTNDEKMAAKADIFAEIKANDMSPYARFVSEGFGWPVEESELLAMDARNTAKIAALDVKLKDAVENGGDTDIRDVLNKKVEHYARIGDLDNVLKLSEECFKKTLGPGQRLDLLFQRIRLGIAFGNNDVAAKGIEDAERIIKDGDWERRNRLKVYEGVYYVFVRDFKKASALLVECLATFASTELVDFKLFVFLTVIAALPHLGRAELKKKIIDSPEVVSANQKELNELLTSLHRCKYNQVLPALEQVCNACRQVVFVTSHVNYFFREVRVLAFEQYLDSYSSVTLSSMSGAFGIPVPVLDAMLSTLICNERLACKIDRVSGAVTTYRGDAANIKFHKILKSGDLLLNRIQKLSRLVESQ